MSLYGLARDARGTRRTLRAIPPAAPPRTARIIREAPSAPLAPAAGARHACRRAGHRRHGPRPGRAAGGQGGRYRHDRRGADRRECRRAAGKRACGCRRAPAVPPLGRALGQSDQSGHFAARDRRQCLEPRLADPGWRAAGRSVRRMGALSRLCHRSHRAGARHAWRRQRLFRGGRAGRHGGDRKRRAGRSRSAAGDGGLWQPGLGGRARVRHARARRRIRDAVGRLRARRRLHADRRRRPRSGRSSGTVRTSLGGVPRRDRSGRRSGTAGKRAGLHRHARSRDAVQRQPVGGRRRQSAPRGPRRLGLCAARLCPDASIRLAVRRHRRCAQHRNPDAGPV